MRALLWDIDGTLTRSTGAGTRALAASLRARPAALAELRTMRLDGMTDHAIVRILLAAELGHLQAGEPAGGIGRLAQPRRGRRDVRAVPEGPARARAQR